VCTATVTMRRGWLQSATAGSVSFAERPGVLAASARGSCHVGCGRRDDRRVARLTYTAVGGDGHGQRDGRYTPSDSLHAASSERRALM